MARVPRQRIDQMLVSRGLVSSREKAQALILAGDVLVAGHPARSSGQTFAEDVEIRVREGPAYVSRGGFKLAAALDAFAVVPEGHTCADVGASTGGFTDVLLRRGAQRVYAIDVGYGQIDSKLRDDPRVVVLDRTNARNLAVLAEPIALVTVDVSFISLALILPVIRGWLTPVGTVVAMVKPQFEAGPKRVGKGGVVRDPAVRVATVQSVATVADKLGFRLSGVCPSPIAGPAGNREYFLLLTLDTAQRQLDQPMESIGRAVLEDRAVVE